MVPKGLTHGKSGDKGPEEMRIWMNYLSWTGAVDLKENLQETSGKHCFTNKKNAHLRSVAWKEKNNWRWDKVILACV
jgi:hypothetical protein